MTFYHPALAQRALDEGDREIAALKAEIEKLRADLASIRSVYDFAALEARIAELRADRDNSNRLLDECRHERNVLQKICAERSDGIEKLREALETVKQTVERALDT